MSRGAYLKSMRGVLVAGAVACLLLLVPFAVNLADRGRSQPADPRERIAQTMARHAQMFPHFVAAPRPSAAEVSRKGLIETPLGYLNPKTGDLLQRLPASLKVPEGAQVRTRKGSGVDGVNIVQLESEALQARGYDGVERTLQRYGKVLEVVADRGLVMRVKKADLETLAALPEVESVTAYHPGLKVAPNVGVMPLMQAKRAANPRLELEVELWQDADATEALRQIGEAVGKENASLSSAGGSLLQVKAVKGELVKIAANPYVRHVGERPEWVLQNAETPTILTLGNYEESFNGARPLQDLGIDGGGIDTNGDGQRLKDGSDAVPPQIVAVTDNGISIDAVHFSQSATAVTDPLHLIGSSHRKVQAIQAGEDTGNSCDAVLSGSNTHGNIVAGIIAGNPGQLGFTFNKAIDPAEEPAIKNISLDALARGARIIMQDMAAPGRCTVNELVELGGSLAPGQMLDRLNQAICPKTVATSGPCTGIGGGGTEVHLQVMPFGTPNFDNTLSPQGTYPLSSAQIDQFLVNNRDYMVFSPVGNKGVDPSDLSGRPIWPTIFDGTGADDDPNFPFPPQVTAPATAKNSVTVGGTLSDVCPTARAVRRPPPRCAPRRW
ncbi:MAG: hypothetical protein DMF50_06685 [Acidobacteria bacterium]|nr:MAG: hypothetical protein DMF50_06685 [Acidobacteriota bacterium]